MIIVDTFVWIDHINASERVLAASLRCHLHPIRNLQFVDLHGATCGNELPEFRGCLPWPDAQFDLGAVVDVHWGGGVLSAVGALGAQRGLRLTASQMWLARSCGLSD